MEFLAAFMVYALVSAITPGPNNMMVLASGLNYGFRRTLPHISGIAIGFALLVFLAGLGLFEILDKVPMLYQVLHIASVVYLLYLAWKIATASPLNPEKAAKKKPMTFLHAVAFQWINPKALVMSVAAVTTYVPEVPESNYLFNLTWVSVLYGLICFPCAGAWTMFGDHFRRFFSDPLHYRIFNITMALLLVASLYPLLVEIQV